MSPRKSRARVERHIVQAYKNRGKKILAGPYNCPICNQERLRILISDNEEKVLALCKCGFRENLDYYPRKIAVDYFNMVIDNRAKSIHRTGDG